MCLVVGEMLCAIFNRISQHLAARMFDFVYCQRLEVIRQRIAIEFHQYPVDQFSQFLVVDGNLRCAWYSYNIGATGRLCNKTTNDVMQSRYRWGVSTSVRQMAATAMQQIICLWVRPY